MRRSDPLNRRKSPALPTAHDVARLAGVSRATVSFVLNGCSEGRVAAGTQKRVLTAAETLGYRPNRLASALSTGRTYTIGIFSSIKDVGNVAETPEHLGAADYPGLYAKTVFLAVTLAAARSNLNTTLFLETPDIRMRPEDVADGRVDGVVVFGMYNHHDWVQRVVALGIPCVEIGTRWGRYWVEVDNVGGTRQAIEHLVDLGHRRIAHYIGLPPVPFIPSMEARETGFRAATAAAGIDPDDAPVVPQKEDLARLFADSAPRHRQPTAIFTYNDAAAVEALDLLHTCGLRVPQDVSLVGFDNEIRALTMRPALTTIQNPIDEITRTAVSLLLRQMEGEHTEQEGVTVPTSLVLRDSTSAPPNPERNCKESS